MPSLSYTSSSGCYHSDSPWFDLLALFVHYPVESMVLVLGLAAVQGHSLGIEH